MAAMTFFYEKTKEAYVIREGPSAHNFSKKWLLLHMTASLILAQNGGVTKDKHEQHFHRVVRFNNQLKSTVMYTL